ncbi:MAG: nuclear transport factor 2 family protein, partial [Microcoleus sp. Co-bin12]|nr:nuclear transport factor 2 family protein [Microcoleus sp. Co-bin12]
MRNFLNLMPSASEYFSSRRDEKADRAIVFGFNCGQSIAQMLLCLTVVSAGV